MSLITNGKGIQNAIYGVLKQDGYLIFLGSGGQEIARVKDEEGGEDLPYSLSAQGLELSLKNASGTTISSAKIETPLRHIHQLCYQPNAGEWKFVSDLTKKIIDGGIYIERGTVVSENALSLVIRPFNLNAWQFPTGKDHFYDIKVTLMTANNVNGGDGIGNNTSIRHSSPATTYQFSIYRYSTATTYRTFIINMTDIPEEYLNAWGVVFLVEIEGSPLEAV